jgi:hypothetical protein
MKLSLEDLFQKYGTARELAAVSTQTKNDLSMEIKGVLDSKKLEKVDGVRYACTYLYDRDKSVEEFDEELFARKDPKKFAQYQQMQAELKTLAKKYTKVSVVKGARRLIISAKNQEEE